MMQEVNSTMQIQDQRLGSQKGAIQIQTVIQLQIIVMHSCKQSTIMELNIFFQALTEKVTEEQVLESHDDYKEILKTV